MNDFVPTWSGFISSYITGEPPKLLETLQIRRQVDTGIMLRIAVSADYSAIVEFWSRYFSNWVSCRCVVPISHLEKMASQWELIIAVMNDMIVGTIVRRKIKNLHIREAIWKEAGVIDYFCVHPAWRKKGVGRALLNTIHNSGFRNGSMPPQLIFWEGLRPLPPLAIGIIWSRRCIPGPGILHEDRRGCWDRVKGGLVWTDEPGEEISFWKTSVGVTVVWNTFHRSLPDGGGIGFVIAGDANSLAESSPWSVLLSPNYVEGWKMDSPFQWIGYNLSIGSVGGFPIIGF